MRGAGRHCGNGRGFMLLEVVVAIGLLVLGMALIGAQMDGALDRTRGTDQLARVVFLAESKFAEIDTGLVIPEFTNDVEEDFGRLFPNYAARVHFEPLVDPNTSADPEARDLGLLYVRVDILFDPRRDPEEDFDFANAAVLQTYHTLRSSPRPLDLTADFGMEDDVATKLTDQLAEAGAGALDIRNFSPDVFRDMSMEELAAVLPTLLEALGAQPSDLLRLVPESMRPQLQAIFDQQGADTNGVSGEGSGAGGATGGGGAGTGAGDGRGGDVPSRGGRRGAERRGAPADDGAGGDEMRTPPPGGRRGGAGRSGDGGGGS